jgi:hypothetical protein
MLPKFSQISISYVGSRFRLSAADIISDSAMYVTINATHNQRSLYAMLITINVLFYNISQKQDQD